MAVPEDQLSSVMKLMKRQSISHSGEACEHENNGDGLLFLALLADATTEGTFGVSEVSCYRCCATEWSGKAAARLPGGRWRSR